MMYRNMASALALALVPLHPGLASAQSDEVAAIGEKLRQYEARFNQADAAAVSNLFSEEVIYYDALGRVHEGRDAVEELYQQNFAAGFEDMRIETIEIKVFDDTAYDIARYSVTAPDGERLEGYHLAILSREEGTWEVERTLVNAIMPSTPE